MPRRLLLLCLALTAMHAFGQGLEVRVLLERTPEAVRVSIDEGHSGYLGDRLLFETPLGIAWPLSSESGRLAIDGTAVAEVFTLVPRSGKVTWGGREYRGSLRFVAEGDSLLVINVLELEEYLRGVVPAEMVAAWPLEALKAQAVASRTYTVVSLDGLADYDICATVECQAYEGISAENLRADRAVAETAGLVLTYAGEFARTYYHSDSGGALASSAEVWGDSLPYLASRSDVAASTPHRRWRLQLDAERLERLLAERGQSIGPVRALRILAYSESGRAQRAELLGGSGQAVLSGAALTSLLRDAGLKSTRFAMVGDLVAQGDGWGHGVGMSQYGARSLALADYRFDEILDFYYPDTTLQRLVAAGDERRP